MGPVCESMRRAFIQLEEKKVDRQSGLLLNYTDDDGRAQMPDARDYYYGRPNHMGWNTPVEDGAYYNGFYLDALCCRAQYLGDVRAAHAARRVASGLVRLADYGVPGFIARGVYNGAHYACGSEDQTFPWLYGLWRYVRSGVAGPEQKARCVKALTRVAGALRDLNFRIPCAKPGFGYRGDYRAAAARDVCKLAFLTRMMYDITGKREWLDQYESDLESCPQGSAQTRQAIIEHMRVVEKYDGQSVFYCLPDGEAMDCVFGRKRLITQMPLFTSSMIHIALCALKEMETNPARRALFKRVLNAEARAAVTHLKRYEGLYKYEWPIFCGDWRRMNALWREQHNSDEAVAVAWSQMPVWFETCPRFPFENALVREPLFAACIVAFGADRDALIAARDELSNLLTAIPWRRLNTSTFYAALLAHGQLLRSGWTARD